MKLYVVYFRTMQDSPEVEIKCATTSKFIAEQTLTKAQREAEEWMADEDEDSDDDSQRGHQAGRYVLRYDRNGLGRGSFHFD